MKNFIKNLKILACELFKTVINVLGGPMASFPAEVPSAQQPNRTIEIRRRHKSHDNVCVEFTPFDFLGRAQREHLFSLQYKLNSWLLTEKRPSQARKSMHAALILITIPHFPFMNDKEFARTV